MAGTHMQLTNPGVIVTHVAVSSEHMSYSTPHPVRAHAVARDGVGFYPPETQSGKGQAHDCSMALHTSDEMTGMTIDRALKKKKTAICAATMITATKARLPRSTMVLRVYAV